MLHPAAAPRPKTIGRACRQLNSLDANVWIIGAPAAQPFGYGLNLLLRLAEPTELTRLA
jgi:hypothetical protein